MIITPDCHACWKKKIYGYAIPCSSAHASIQVAEMVNHLRNVGVVIGVHEFICTRVLVRLGVYGYKEVKCDFCSIKSDKYGEEAMEGIKYNEQNAPRKIKRWEIYRK